MASIEAFLDLAVADTRPRNDRRLTLRSRARAGRHELHAGFERGLVFAAVIALHIVLMFALQSAMRPPALRTDAVGALQIVFITPRRASVPEVHRPVPPLEQRGDRVRASAPRQRVIPRAAATMPNDDAFPRSGVGYPQRAVLYNLDGSLRMHAPVVPPPRDLLAHRRADWMLPGAGRPGVQGFRFRETLTPQRALQRVGMLFGGGPYDPCPGIEQDMTDLDDAKVREQAERRYEESCEGR